MQNINQTQLNDAARLLINTRELCGDEKEAFIEWCADNNLLPTQSLYSYVRFEVNRQWRNIQREAGVDKTIY